MPIKTDDPVLVLLSDGRRVPLGPGVICDDACLPPTAPGRSIWRWAAPLIGGGAILTGLLILPGGKDSTTKTNPPIVTPSPVVTPTPSAPVQPVTPVPEPATIFLTFFGAAGVFLVVKRNELV